MAATGMKRRMATCLRSPNLTARIKGGKHPISPINGEVKGIMLAKPWNFKQLEINLSKGERVGVAKGQAFLRSPQEVDLRALKTHPLSLEKNAPRISVAYLWDAMTVFLYYFVVISPQKKSAEKHSRSGQ